MMVVVLLIDFFRSTKGKTSRNVLPSRSVHSICTVSILEVRLDGARKIYEDRTVEFEVQQTRDRLGQRLIELQIEPDIVVLGVERMTFRRAPIRCEVKW